MSLDDPWCPEALGNSAAERGDGDGPQHALGLEVPDDGGRGGAEGRGDGDHGRRPAGDGPTRDDEHDRAEEPVRNVDHGPVERHPQGPHAGQVGHRGVTTAEQAVAALPADHGDQQSQGQPRQDRERHEQVAEEDGQVEGGQVLELDAVLRGQPEPQEAQHEESSDDVGLQHAEGEHRPWRARHPTDEGGDSPHLWRRPGHASTVSVQRRRHGRCSPTSSVECRRGALGWRLMSGVFSRLVGQDAVEAELVAAAHAAAVIRLTTRWAPAPRVAG